MNFIKVISTGSKGNSYVIKAGDKYLILDIGIPSKKILKEVNFDTKNVEGILITHTHKDHIYSINDMEKENIKILAPCDIYAFSTSSHITVIKDQTLYTLGEFQVFTFKLDHDVNTYGYYIYHKKIGTLVYITDTNSIDYTVKANNILVEINYETTEIKPDYHTDRALRTHMSDVDTINFLRNSDLDDTKNVLIIHTSSSNSNVVHLRAKLKKLFPKVNIDVADDDMLIEI